MSRKARLGRGVVAHPDEVVARSGLALLAAVEKHCPEVLEAAAAAGPEGVEAWAERYNLAAPWCRELVGEWVRHPQDEPPWHRPEVWHWAGRPYPGADRLVFRVPRGPSFQVYGWNPEGPTPRAEAQERMLRQLREQVDEVLGEDHTAELARQVDAYLKRVETDLPRTPGRDREHYRWAALYLCRGLSYQRIADMLAEEDPSRENVERSTVSDAVSRTLRPLGLSRRR